MSSLSARFSPLFTAMLGIVSAIALTACVAPQHAANGQSPATTALGAAAETGPQFVEGLGYKFTWTRTDASLVSPPAEVKDAARKLCSDNGFDVAFMRSIAFSDDEAVGYFGCRGSGGN
ncbi:MAG: hypothetical protein J4F41_02160 [Alphaproteobacteria bacterium]|nr:hypothetical protein [Alphaproteobacteria bacterium]